MQGWRSRRGLELNCACISQQHQVLNRCRHCTRPTSPTIHSLRPNKHVQVNHPLELLRCYCIHEYVALALAGTMCRNFSPTGLFFLGNMTFNRTLMLA